MNWLSPTLGIAAAAVAVPLLIVLYFLRLRRREVEVSSTLLWKKSVEDLQANAPFQRLRRNILLLLQLLVLAGVLLAVAEPQFLRTTSGGRQIILIDRSASMAARDGDPAGRSRLEVAQERAVELVRALRPPGLMDRGSGDEAMVIAFDTSAEVIQTFTNQRERLIDAIRAVAVTDAPSSAAEAFRLARAHVPRKKHVDRDGSVLVIEGLAAEAAGTIHLFSDGRLPDAGEVTIGRDDGMIFHAIGRPASANIAISALRADRAFADPNMLSIFAGVQSTDPAERTVDVELQIDGVVEAIKSVTLPGAVPVGVIAGTAEPAPPAGDATTAPAADDRAAPRPIPTTRGVTFSLRRPAGAVLTVQLAGGLAGGGGDTLATDNAAFKAIPPAVRSAVAIVSSRGLLPIDAALERLPLSKLETFTPAQYEAAVAAGRARAFDVVVFDGLLPASPAEAEPGSLPPGRFVILGAVPTVGTGIRDAGVGPASVVIDWNRTHPVLLPLTLDAVYFAASRRVDVDPRAGSRAIAMTDAGPAIVEFADADTRALIVPSDPAQGNWPLDASFVVFLGSAVSYLADEARGGPTAEQLRPGDVLRDRLPQGVADIRLQGPVGPPQVLAAESDGTIAAGPLVSSGIYRISWRGAGGPRDAEVGGRFERAYAANLLDPHESDAAPEPVLRLASRVVAAEAGGADAGSAQAGTAAGTLWPWLVMAGLAILMFEWFVYHRKVQV